MANQGHGLELCRSLVASSLLGALALLGCSSGNAEVASAGEEQVGEAKFELTSVPSGAVCMDVQATQGSSVYHFPVTLPGVNGNSSAVTVGKLPLGSVSLQATVYSVACSAIANASAGWLSEYQTVEFRPGVVANVSFTLRPVNTTVASVNFVGNITKIYAGYGTSGLVMSDGTARLAGNWYPLNGGTTFIPYSGVSGIDELAPAKTYNAHSCMRSTDGTVRCAGGNGSGQLGPNGGSFSATPVVVPGLGTARQVSVGYYHSCALNTGGGTYCWGANSDGQLGFGMPGGNTATPTLVAIGIADQIVAAPYHTCANQVGGDLACWGYNAYGQLGDGTTTSRSTPSGTGLNGVVSFDLSYYHGCAVRADGTLRCWGYNGYGELGDGSTTMRLSPVVVPGINDAVQVAVGMWSTCVLRGSGAVNSVSCWGYNAWGQLGDGTGQSHATPATVPGLSGVTSIASGNGHVCALMQDRRVMCWGLNDSGQTGNVVLSSPFKPTAATVQ